MNRRLLFVAAGLVALSGIYWGWITVTSPWGSQVVHYGPSSKSCFAGGTEVKWKYCLHSAPQGTNGGIAYLLHGRGHDENTWNDDTFYTAMIQKYWADHGIKPPQIVAITFGPEWILAPKGKAPKSGLLDVFFNELIPEVEKKTGTPTYRAVFGESMGGMNSLIAGLSRPEKFKKVMALCSPIYEVTPYSGFEIFRDFTIRTGADPRVALGIRQMGQRYAGDDDAWKQVSPYELIKQVKTEGLPELYVSAGLYDKYGNFEGSLGFSEIAKARGIPLIWRPMYGPHCASDITSAAEFIGSPPVHL